MTDAELRDAAVSHLKNTTVGYRSTKTCKHAWVTPPPGTEWYAALALLAQIGEVTPAPPDQPQPPILSNPLTFTAVSGQTNFFQANGRDAVVKANGLVEQSATATGNAVITLTDAPNSIWEGIQTYSAHTQSGNPGNGYGYGLYAVRCGRAYFGDCRTTGPGLAQGIVGNGTQRITTERVHIEALHPVWKKSITPSRPAEVHTDGIQSYGGPGLLELYDTTIRSCGSPIQVQPFAGTVFPMLPWIMHRLNVEQVTVPDSDEMPFCVTKDQAGKPTWPTDFQDCWIHALGFAFGVSWKIDPAAWAPSGSWANTGSAWQNGSPPGGDYAP